MKVNVPSYEEIQCDRCKRGCERRAFGAEGWTKVYVETVQYNEYQGAAATLDLCRECSGKMDAFMRGPV